MEREPKLGSRGNARRALNVLLFVLAFSVLLAFLWFVPELQVRYFAQGAARGDIPTLVNEYRRTWAQIIGGFFVLLGLYFTWRRVEISQKTLETQQDQQVTERFTRAIDQLGKTDDDSEPRLEIRLGGIYALERIAWDSPGRDYSTVIEVLTAYVRANAPYSPKTSPDPDAAPNEASEQGENGEQDKDVEHEAQHSPKEPSADIQAILDVIKRRGEDRVPEEYRVRPDLRRTNLERANLTGANLTGADLTGVDLEEEQLEQAIGDATTRLPEGFTRPASWTTGTDEQADGDE